MSIRFRPGAGLPLLLVVLACSGVRPPVPTERFQTPQGQFLVIRDTLDEAQAVTWLSASEFDRSLLDQALVRSRDSGPVVLAARRARDCDKEQIECFRRCWKRKPPYPSERGDPGHYAHCQETCLRAYEDCLARNKLLAQEFSVMDDAIDWLKRHHREVLVGTLITAAGVTFIVVSAGAGALVLAPLVLVADAGSALEGAVCEGGG
jgi:hypothetical protein